MLGLLVAKLPEGGPFGGLRSQRLSTVIETRAEARKWRFIVIHHSATVQGSASKFEIFHMLYRGWAHIGYHFVIGNGTDTGDGRIEPTPVWVNQIPGIHARNRTYNEWGIAVCLVGNFDQTRPTELQMKALVGLAAALTKKFHIPPSDVTYHNHIVETDCPGKLFPYAEFQARLEKALSQPLEVVYYKPAAKPAQEKPR